MYLQKDLPQSIFKQLKTLGKSEIIMELISDKTNVRFKRLNILERIVKNVKKKKERSRGLLELREHLYNKLDTV